MSVGWNVVDFFFVLSGFIITYIHLRDLRQRTNLGSFLLKRFNRIYPVFWIVGFLYFSLAVLIKQNTLADLFSPGIIKSFLLIKTEKPVVGV